MRLITRNLVSFKKLTCIAVFCLFGQGIVLSQNIKNASFDSVYIGAIDRIADWITSDTWVISSSGGSVSPMSPGTHFVASGLAYHEMIKTVAHYSSPSGSIGVNGIELQSRPDCVYPGGALFKGYIVNGNHFYTNSAGYLDLGRCGEPFPHRPTAIKGYYKFTTQGNDYGMATIILKKYNTLLHKSDTVGIGSSQSVLSSQQAWTAFTIPINYISSVVPDTIVVAFFASTNNVVSTLHLDHLFFDYSTVGVAEVQNEAGKLHIGQDVVQQRLNLVLPENIIAFELELRDINGRMVGRASNEKHPDISGLQPGIYMLQLCSDKEYFNGRFIKD